jgi:hypothetical protein
MENNKKNQIDESIHRILLMMKYDASKTLVENEVLIRENTTILSESSGNCPNTISLDEIKSKSEKIADLVKKMNTMYIGAFYIDERCKEIYDIINEISKKNFYDETLKECQKSLVRLRDEFETEYRDWFSDGEPLEEELQDLIDGRPGEESVTARNYLKSALKILSDSLEGGDAITDITPRVSPPTTTRYRDCGNGPFSKGCSETDTNGPIHRLQSCLGVVSDGKFWTKTEAALMSQHNKTSVTAEEINRICISSQSSQMTNGNNQTPSSSGGASTDNINLGGEEYLSTVTDF